MSFNHRDRKNNLKIGLHYDRVGEFDLASKAYKNAFSKSEIVFDVIQELRLEGVRFIVSPYEGDAQLRKLMSQGKIDVAVSDDTDLLPYVCSSVIFSTDKDGFLVYFNRYSLDDYQTACAKEKLRFEIKMSVCETKEDPHIGCSKEKRKTCIKEKVPLNFSGLNADQLILFCVLKGCDYFDGVGLDDKSLLKLVSNKDFNRTMVELKSKQTVKAEDLETQIFRAYMTYKHHLVYDQELKKVVNLTKPPNDVDLGFLGCVLPDEIAIGIAEGIICPRNLLPYEAPKALNFLAEMDEGIRVNRQLTNQWQMRTQTGGIQHTFHSITDFDSFISWYKGVSLITQLKDGDASQFFLDDYKVVDADGHWTQMLRPSEIQNSWKLNCATLMEGKLPHKELVIGTQVSLNGKWAQMRLWTKCDSTEFSSQQHLAIAKDWKGYTKHEPVIGYALRQSPDVGSQSDRKYFIMI